MANVGSLWVSLGLNSAAFTSGRKKANKELQSLASSVKSIQGMIVGGLAAIGIAATAGAAKEFVSAQMDVIDATAKVADRLNIGTETLIGYRHAANLAGVGNEEFDKTLEKMTRNIGLAAQMTGAQRDAIEALGLSAGDLASMGPDKALATIADRFKEIKNPAERAAIAADLFGRAGQSLQNTLLGGSQALADAQAEAQKLGIAFSRIDAAQVEAANDAWTRAQEVIRGVAVQVAIGLSPYLTAATDQFIQMATAGGGIGPKVGSAIEWVATGLAHVSDYLSLAKAGFKTMQGIATGAILAIVKAIDWAGSGLVKLLNLVGVDAQWSSFAGMFADNLRTEMDQAFADAGDAYNDFLDGKASAKVKATFAQIKADATAAGEAVAAAAAAPLEAIDHAAAESVKSIQKVLDGLQKDIDTFGMDAGQKKLFDLEAMGASPEQIAQARELIDSYAKLESAQKKQQDLMAQGKAILDSTRTPMEQYEEQIGKLSELLESGAIDWETYGRAVRKAREELEGVADEKTGRSATLGERFALQARSGQMSVGGQRAMENGGGGKIRVDGVDKTNKILESIDGNLRRGLPAVLA